MSPANRNSSKTRKTRESPAKQLERFHEMARELGADESSDALDKAFARLDPKRRPLRAKSRRKSP